jgi:hypothetical protein
MMRAALCGLVWLGTAAVGSAQTASTVAAPPVTGAIATHPEWPVARPEDVSSPQAIIAAVSDAISNDGTKPRDWTRVQSLFVPGAGRMIPSRLNKDGSSDVTVLTLDEYRARAGNNLFVERPIAYDIQTFGRMTHVYESYGIRHKADDAEPYVKGVNSVELFYDGKRYWVVQFFWDTERPDNPLPVSLKK